MAKKQVLQLTFVSGGKPLYTLTADDFQGPVEIGRGESARWRPSDADMTMLPRHAVMIAHGDLSVKIEPIDGAPIFKNARPFTGGKLAVGDRIAVGDSEITVKTVAKIEKAREKYHRLEGMNGEAKGKMVSVTKKLFKVGSAPDNDLVIKSDIVAAHQAELSIDERGSLWVKDLASRNGTFVNGERLTDKARMVKNGDVIGFSIWDYRFLDRTVLHVRSNASLQVILALVTAAICVGIYALLQLRVPEWTEVGQEIMSLIAQDRFDEGIAKLEEIHDARGAQDHKDIIALYRGYIERWHHTYRDWEMLKEIVRTQRSSGFADALDVMGRLRADVPEEWSWRPEKSRERMAEEDQTEQMLNLYFSLQKMLSGHGTTEGELENIEKRIVDFGIGDEKWLKEEKREWIKPLKEELVESVKSLREYQAAVKQINGVVGKCSTDVAALEALYNNIRKIERDSGGFLRIYAGQVGDPLGDLLNSCRQIASNETCIVEMQPDLIHRHVEIPSVDDCLVSDHLLTLRSYFVKRHAQVKLVAARLSSIIRQFKRAKPPKEMLQKVSADFMRQEYWKSVLGCDTFDMEPPNRRRTKPVSDYDEVVGIEWMWSYLHELPLAYPEDVPLSELNGSGFTPLLFVARDFFVTLRRAHDFLVSKEFQEFNRGMVSEFRKDIEWRFGRLATGIRHLDKVIAEGKDSRAALLALGCKILMSDMKDVKQEDVKRLRSLVKIRRQKIEEIELAYGDSETDEDLRKSSIAILKEAIPGDPMVLPHWKFHAMALEADRIKKEKGKGKSEKVDGKGKSEKGEGKK